jgi:hypothetical protein
LVSPVSPRAHPRPQNGFEVGACLDQHPGDSDLMSALEREMVRVPKPGIKLVFTYLLAVLLLSLVRDDTGFQPVIDVLKTLGKVGVGSGMRSH